MPITILKASNYKIMPWKNGNGVTTEIAVYPPDASMDDFGWRVSMASVTEDGAFSQFTGIDRVLTMLDGVGMTLTVEDLPKITLSIKDQPFAFPADSPCMSTLKDGPITDFNVMTRRGHYKASVYLRGRYQGQNFTPDVRMTFAAHGALSGTLNGQGFDLELRDTLLIDKSGDNTNEQNLTITTQASWLDVHIISSL